MSIVFEPLTSAAYDTFGRSLLAFRHAGRGEAISIDDSIGAARFALRVFGVSYEVDNAELDPPIPAMGASTMLFDHAGASYLREFHEGTSFVALRHRGADIASDSSVGRSVFQLGHFGYEAPALTAYAFITPKPPTITSYAGITEETFQSIFNIGDSTSLDLALVFQSNAQFADSSSLLARLNMLLQSNITIRDAFAFVVSAAFEDTFAIADTDESRLRGVMLLADQITLTDELLLGVDALLAAASAFTIRDAVRYAIDIGAESEFAINDALLDQISALFTTVSDFAVADELEGTLTLSMLFVDDAAFADAPSYGLSAALEFLDTASFNVRFSLPGNDGGLYVGYAMNIRNAGVSTYDNYPFTGFATVGGIPLAVGDDGLYRIGGATDAGEPIHARIRTGLTDFGTDMLKRSPNMYLGLKTDGSMLLKVITNKHGRKQANVYRLTDASGRISGVGRFDIAKGLVGLYWGYELENVDGADFELDTIRVWPFAVQRRKSGR